MRGRIKFIPLIMIIGWLATAVQAQEPPSGRLIITGSEVGSPPQIELRAYGMDGEGRPLDLTQTPLSLMHNGAAVTPLEHFGTHPAGTFTLFLIDIPIGVSGQFDAIQEAIRQYAAPPTMEEQVDAVAIYQVGETAANQLLPPDRFHNSVRNLLSVPFVPSSGATALVDSAMSLLNQIEDLKPVSDMFASIVIISDGTDVVSARFQPDDVPARAAELGVPIYAIWLNNENLSPAGKGEGQSYLEEIAAESRGLFAQMADGGGVSAIWSRIAAFREQYRLVYTVDDLSGGAFPVTLSLVNEPDVTAETIINVPANSPSIVINLPAASRLLTLPSVDEPVKLQFSTTARWLDGVERQFTAVQLVVNEIPTEIPADSVAEFEVELSNLVMGNNAIQIAALDEQGMRVTSPLLVITVQEGRRSLPDELNPRAGIGRAIGTAFLLLLALGGLGGFGFYAWRQGWLGQIPAMIPRGPRRRPGLVELPDTVSDLAPDLAPGGYAQAQSGPVRAYLEVLDAVSPMGGDIPVRGTQVRIGRSPAQSDVVFEKDVTVSRLHASLMLEGSHYRIFDERSTSGTWVNDQQVPEYGIQLLDGDEIYLGAVHLRFRQP